MNIKHILLTTDLSPESLRACGPVGDLARSTGARVTLLHVVHDVTVVPHAEAVSPGLSTLNMEDHIKRARTALSEAQSGLGEGIEVSLTALSGTNVAKMVSDWASSHEVDLITLSTHGRTGFRHLVLGSVAEAIVRHAPVPVMCFPAAPKAD